MEITERDIEAIHDSHDKIIRMETILGNGDKGLCHDVRCHQKRISRIELFIALLIGTGVLTGGAIGLLKLVGS